MINEDRNWEYALVTFTDGMSYNVGGVRFMRGMPKRVTKLAVRRAIDGVDGFQIGDVYTPEAPAPAPFVPPVEESEEEETETEVETEESPKPKVVKRKKTKKRVKSVKRGND